MADLLHDRPTPFLLVDDAVVASNVAEMTDSARLRGLALRPHAKTHKSGDIARLQLDAGAVGLTVATVAEAQVFADAGCEDMFIAYPLWVDAAKGARLRDLSSRVSLTIGIDSVAGALALAAQLPGARALVEVDSGQHRSGSAPSEAGALAEVAARAGLDVAGVFTFPGHSYAPGVAAEVAAEEAVALGDAAASLRGHGVEPVVVSGGSTPTAAEADGGVLTELRPGVYVFGDAQQWELDTISPEHIALTCIATVVSHGSSDGRPCRPRFRQQGTRCGPRPLGHRLRTAPRPPGGTDRPALRAPRRRRVGRLPSPGPRQPGARRTQPRVRGGQPPRRARAQRRKRLAGARARSQHVKRPALVIFDCDGVLVDTERLTVGLEARLLTELGWEMDADEVVRRWMGRTSKTQLAEVEAQLGPERTREFERRTDGELLEIFERELSAVDGVADLVEQVHKAGVTTCVASSGTHERMRQTLGLTGLYDAFDGRIFSATEVEHGKPAPDLFLHAAASIGVEPSDCAVVEDSVYGVQAAVAAGMTVFGFAGGLAPEKALADAGAVTFEAMADLVPLLGLRDLG